MEQFGENTCRKHQKNIGQAARDSPTYDISHKSSFNTGIIRFERKEKGGHTDGQRADQRELDRLQGIGHVDEQQYQRQCKRKNIFD